MSALLPREPRPTIEITPLPGGRSGAGIEVRPGEILILTGGQGGAAAALLEAAVGRRTSVAVQATIGGLSLGDLSPRTRRKAARSLRLCYIASEPALISNLTIMENLLLPIRYVGGRDEAEAAQEALERLGAAGLQDAARWLPARLTPSERKSVALIRGLLPRPLAAVMHEPVSGLEGASLESGKEQIRAALGEGGCAILAAAHDPAPYEDLGARTVNLGDLLHHEAFESRSLS